MNQTNQQLISCILDQNARILEMNTRLLRILNDDNSSSAVPMAPLPPTSSTQENIMPTTTDADPSSLRAKLESWDIKRREVFMLSLCRYTHDYCVKPDSQDPWCWNNVDVDYVMKCYMSKMHLPSTLQNLRLENPRGNRYSNELSEYIIRMCENTFGKNDFKWLRRTQYKMLFSCFKDTPSNRLTSNAESRGEKIGSIPNQKIVLGMNQREMYRKMKGYLHYS